MIFDARRAKALANLEEFEDHAIGQARSSRSITTSGASRSTVTAEISTRRSGRGDHHYLVRGNVTTRRAEVIRDGVECPSLSPDGTRIAFKSRADDPFVWRLHILDLKTGAEKQLPYPEVFDDQAEWLDNDHIAYDRNQVVMSVKADGSSPPIEMLPRAGSAAAVR